MGDTQRLLDIGLGGNRHVTDHRTVIRRVHSQGLFRHGTYLESYIDGLPFQRALGRQKIAACGKAYRIGFAYAKCRSCRKLRSFDLPKCLPDMVSR
ncbi:hypothetical protein D3C86_1987840 [compost metagenome]